MTTIKRNSKGATVEALVASDPDLMKALMKQALQEVLEGEMTELLGAAPGERANTLVAFEKKRWTFEKNGTRWVP